MAIFNSYVAVPEGNWCFHYEQFDFRGHCGKKTCLITILYSCYFMLSTFCTPRKGMWICWRSGPDGAKNRHMPRSDGISWYVNGCHDVMAGWTVVQWYDHGLFPVSWSDLVLVFCWGIMRVGGRHEPRGRKKELETRFQFLCAQYPLVMTNSLPWKITMFKR